MMYLNNKEMEEIEIYIYAFFPHKLSPQII